MTYSFMSSLQLSSTLNMPDQSIKGFGCLSIGIGVILAIATQALMSVNRPQFDLIWQILVPALVYFDPGRDDGVEIFLATIIDTVYYAAIVYAVTYSVIWFASKRKYQ